MEGSPEHSLLLHGVTVKDAKALQNRFLSKTSMSMTDGRFA